MQDAPVERFGRTPTAPGGEPALVRTGAAPLYAQVADVLRRRIEDGTFRTGDHLPPIKHLMAEFKVSRVTVRDAIKRLSAEGLASPQRGRGTLVTGAVRRRPLRVEGTLGALVDIYRGDQPEVRNLAEGFLQPSLKSSDGTLAERYFHMRRVHVREGVRYCIIALYIEAGVFARAEARFRDELVLPVLLDLDDVVIADARQSVTIGKCSASDAAIMGFPPGDPVANVHRTLVRPDGTVLYAADVVYRGDCIRFDMDLRP